MLEKQKHSAFSHFQTTSRTHQFSTASHRPFAAPFHYAIPQHHAASSLFLVADALPPPATAFEPVLNVPAFITSFLILGMALLLYLRANAIGDAADRRMAALEELRAVKSKELALEASEEEVEVAVRAYETSLQEEEGLRTLLPGVRLRAPNNPVNSEKDQQAARQFLKDDSILPTPMEEAPRSRLGPVAIGFLLAFLLSQLFLFAFLNMDDTTATEVFNSIAESTSDPAVEALVQPASPETTVAETIGDLVGLE